MTGSLDEFWNILNSYGSLIGLIGVFIGGLITWLASRHYYMKAGDELRIEAGKLREEALEINRLTNTILMGLHNAGIIEAKWQDGKLVGLVIKITPEPAIAVASVGSPGVSVSCSRCGYVYHEGQQTPPCPKCGSG